MFAKFAIFKLFRVVVGHRLRLKPASYAELGNMEIWRCGDMEMWRFEYMKIWRYGDLEIRDRDRGYGIRIRDIGEG